MSVAFLMVLLGAGAASSAPVDQITIDDRAVMTKGKRVVTAGTYRCVSDAPLEPVMVTSTVKQGDTSVSGGAKKAVCDGQLHSWSVESQPFETTRLAAGKATVQSTLMQLKRTGGLVPLMPSFRAVADRQVDLTGPQ
ncbi:DUF6299 family protein [Streptomyces sp. NPDC054871]